MSKIKTELMKATDVTAKRGEDNQEFLARLMKGVSDLNDKEWEGLSKEAQDWFNDAADAKNAKAKTLPDFPDLEKAEQEEEKPKTRRGAAKEEPEDEAPAKPKVGAVAKITTKRGKSSTGTIVEIDDDVVVIKHGDGTEEEFDRSRVESIELASTGKASKKEEPEDQEEADPVKVGATVMVVTKRGKEVTGKIVEIDEEVVVLDVDGKDEEFDRSRVESIKLAGKADKASKKEEPADEDQPKTRRGAAKEEPEDKPKRSSNVAGVSVGTRIKELIADDLEATEAEIGKQLAKEKIEFRDNTLKLQYTDCHKFVAILKAKKLIKG
jgi:ribosome maturation factor RimP